MLTGMFFQAVHAFPFFGDMSGTGHYPYDFIDMFHNKGNYAQAIGIKINNWVQLIVILATFLITQSLYFVMVYFPARHQFQKQLLQEQKSKS